MALTKVQNGGAGCKRKSIENQDSCTVRRSRRLKVQKNGSEKVPEDEILQILYDTEIFPVETHAATKTREASINADNNLFNKAVLAFKTLCVKEIITQPLPTYDLGNGKEISFNALFEKIPDTIPDTENITEDKKKKIVAAIYVLCGNFNYVQTYLLLQNKVNITKNAKEVDDLSVLMMSFGLITTNKDFDDMIIDGDDDVKKENFINHFNTKTKQRILNLAPEASQTIVNPQWKLQVLQNAANLVIDALSRLGYAKAFVVEAAKTPTEAAKTPTEAAKTPTEEAKTGAEAAKAAGDAAKEAAEAAKAAGDAAKAAEAAKAAGDAAKAADAAEAADAAAVKLGMSLVDSKLLNSLQTYPNVLESFLLLSNILLKFNYLEPCTLLEEYTPVQTRLMIALNNIGEQNEEGSCYVGAVDELASMFKDISLKTKEKFYGPVLLPWNTTHIRGADIEISPGSQLAAQDHNNPDIPLGGGSMSKSELKKAVTASSRLVVKAEKALEKMRDSCSKEQKAKLRDSLKQAKSLQKQAVKALEKYEKKSNK